MRLQPLSILVFLFVLSNVTSFVFNQRRYSSKSLLSARQRRTQIDEPIISEVTYTPGKDIPEEVLKHQCIYDMILIERMNAPLKTATGIILPVVEGKDQKKTGIIVSMGKDYGLESEQGRVQGMDEIAPYRIGDTVYVQDPWGIGPKDITVGERCFSFIKADHILGLMK